MRLLALAGGLVLVATAALAQDDTVISASPFVDLLMPYVQLIVTGVLIPVALAFAMKRMNLDMEAHHREALQTSLTNAAGLAIAKGGAAAGSVSFDVRNKAFADAVRYVQNSAPDAVKKWGLTPEVIAEKIRAKLPQVATAPASTPATSNIPGGTL